MAAPVLLLLLFISSAYSIEEGCPGNYGASSELQCKPEYFYTIKPGVCCPQMISKKLKESGIVWPVAGEKENIATNTKKSCNKNDDCGLGMFCDVSTPMDENWNGLKGNLKNCYKAFKCHGTLPNSNIIRCKTNDKCPGGFCDTKVSELIPEIEWNNDGICCQMPKCPLANQLSEKSCKTDNDCSTDSKWCFTFKSGKHCCPIDKKYLCPDGSRPSKVEGILNHQQGKDFKCEQNKESKMKAEDGKQMCCPRIISQDYNFARIDKEPVNPGQTCASNSNCNTNEFCGVSMLVNSATPLSISHCYLKPSCIGTSTVAHPTKGLKYCSASEKCGANEACDSSPFGLSDKAICCSFECGSGPLEAKSGEKGTAGGICTGCDNEKDQWSYCGDELVNNLQQLDICKKVGSEDGKYRQCTYNREPAKCPNGYAFPLRKKSSYELMECNTDSDCQIQGERSQCVKVASSTEKICCRGDFCPDIWLWRKKEKPCTQDNDCWTWESKGFCDKTKPGGKQDPKGHCCPHAEVINQKIHVDGPYRSNKDCTKLEDCLGENRFCDPYSKKCMYHRKSLVLGELQSGKTCDKDKMDCGENRIVCMAEELTNQPKCYRHPRDECDNNSQCQKQGKYCAPMIETTGKDSLHECYLIPTDASVVGDKVGLVLCGPNKKCNDAGHECRLDNSVPGVKEGYCRKKVHRQCRGRPMLTYTQGLLRTCSGNAQCYNEGFCDVDVKPHVGVPGNGFCCSLQISGEGEVVRSSDVGLKTCKKDDECDLKSGEICSQKFTKDANSLWKPEDRVCFKEWCPGSNLRLKEQPACSTAKDCKVSKGEAASCEKGHCCPKVASGQISHPFVTNATCQSVNECSEKRMFCDPDKKRCVYFGADKDFVTTEKCLESTADCKIKDVAGVCVYADEDRTKDPQCWVNPLLGRKSGTGAEASGKGGGPSTTVIVIIVVVAVLILLAAAGVGGFFLYKKIDKKMKEKKKAKLAKIKAEKEKQAKEKAKKEKEAKEKAKKEKEAKEKAEKERQVAELDAQMEKDAKTMDSLKYKKKYPPQFISL